MLTPITNNLRRTVNMGESAFGEVLTSHADLERDNILMRRILTNICLSWDANTNSRIEYSVIEQAKEFLTQRASV